MFFNFYKSVALKLFLISGQKENKIRQKYLAGYNPHVFLIFTLNINENKVQPHTLAHYQPLTRFPVSIYCFG